MASAYVAGSGSGKHVMVCKETCQFYTPLLDEPESLLTLRGAFIFSGMIVNHRDTNILEAQLPTPKSLEERSV